MKHQRTENLPDQPANQHELVDWALLFGGGILAFWGLRRWPLAAILATAAGGGLIYLAVSARSDSLMQLTRELHSSREQEHDSRWVDETSAESFPASDPPAVY